MRTFNEKMSIYHGMASAVATNTSNSYIPLFAMTILGATNYQVGLISSIPPLMSLLMTVPAAILLNRSAEHKKLVAFAVLAARLVFLLVLFITLTPAAVTSWLFLGLIAFMSIPNTLATVGWQSFIGHIIDDHRRAHFFSDRNRFMTMIGLVSTLTIGIVMRDYTASVVAYNILFSITFVCGVIEFIFIMRHEETPRRLHAHEKQSMNWSIFKDANYVRFLMVALIFNFGWQMAWGLFNIYNVRYAEASIFWISMFNVGSSISQIIAFPIWRKLCDKHGNMRTFVIVAFGMSTAPFLTILSTNFYYLTFMMMLSGFFVAGTVLILFNLLLENSAAENRTYCITTYNVLLAIVAFVAPQIGIFLLETWTMNVAMTLSTVMRFAAASGFLYVYLKSKK